MPFSYDANISREIILDHYQNPRNYKQIDSDDFIKIHMDHSDNCTDDIYVYLKVENNVIKECYWYGHACAISTASSSIMTELVVNKTVEEATKIMDEFNKMMKNEEFDESILDEAVCFVNTYRQPSRVGCATISWRGLKEAFEHLKHEGDCDCGK